MSFPALSLREAIEAFTEPAYGKRLTLNMRETLPSGYIICSVTFPDEWKGNQSQTGKANYSSC